MTKDVLVSISGVHMVDGDPDQVSVITAGIYYYKNGKHYVIYDEVIDGVEGSIRNTIKVGAGKVDIIKTGAAQSHMVFEKEKTNVSCYATPFGQMMVGVNTNDIDIKETEDQMLVKIDYTLEINYEQMSHCVIEVDVQSKATADFHLRS